MSRWGISGRWIDQTLVKGQISAVDMPGWRGILLAAVGSLLVLWVGLQIIGILDGFGLETISEVGLLVLPAACLGALLVWLNERLWLYLAIASHIAVFVSASEQGTGPADLFFAGVVLFGICVWFVKELVVYRRPIVETGFDLLFIAFFVISTIVGLIANYLHGGDLLWFFKESAMIFDIMLYFPLRRAFRGREDIIKVLAVVLLVGFTSGMLGVATYRQRLVEAVYAFQVEGSRVFANEPTAIGFTLIFTVIFGYARRFRTSLFALAGFAIGMVFLIVTFSRGTIVSAAIGIGVVGLLSPWRNTRRIAIALGVGGALCAVMVLSFFPRLAENFSRAFVTRLSTVATATSDVSFNLRVIEATTLLTKYLPQSPVIGFGYGVKYGWLDPVSHTTTSATFIHNGYVRPLFKHGIPLAFLFLLLLTYPLFRLMARPPGRGDSFVHAVMVGSTAYLVAMLVDNYVSDQFSAYSPVLNIALCWALFDYVNRKVVEREAALAIGTVEQTGRPGPATSS